MTSSDSKPNIMYPTNPPKYPEDEADSKPLPDRDKIHQDAMNMVNNNLKTHKTPLPEQGDELVEQLKRIMYLAEPYMNRDGAGLDEDWHEFIHEVQKAGKIAKQDRKQHELEAEIKELKALMNLIDDRSGAPLTKWELGNRIMAKLDERERLGKS